MTLIVGGTTIPTNDDYVKVGSTLVDKVDVVKDGIRTTVWEKIIFTSQDFYCTGSIQEFVVPLSGYYKLEAWGGAGANAVVEERNINYSGGLGGHAVSYAYLSKDSKLYIAVGAGGGTSKLLHTGYNEYQIRNEFLITGVRNNGCGGSYYFGHIDGISYKEHYFILGTGGDCTHISKRSGWASSLASYQSDVLVVAGGGGGGYYSYEPQENGGDDKIRGGIGGAGGSGGDGSDFGTDNICNYGFGSGWKNGTYHNNGNDFCTTGGTNHVTNAIYPSGSVSYSTVSESGINSGSGKAKITFMR